MAKGEKFQKIGKEENTPMHWEVFTTKIYLNKSNKHVGNIAIPSLVRKHLGLEHKQLVTIAIFHDYIPNLSHLFEDKG